MVEVYSGGGAPGAVPDVPGVAFAAGGTGRAPLGPLGW